ncbi:MAG: ATP-binding protein [Clostridia bacterium]|nr:ATP-binding protein [Clostridia bacterium]
MTDRMEQIKNNLLYAGLTKEEYAEIQEAYLAPNSAILRVISLCSGILCLCFGLFMSLRPQGSNVVLYVAIGIINLAVAILAWGRWRGNVGREKILTMVFVMSFYFLGIYTGTIGIPDRLAVLYIAAILALPMVFNDRPAVLLGEMLSTVVVFSILAVKYKEPVIASTDVMDAVVFALVSIILNTFLYQTKAKGCLNEARVKQTNRKLQETYDIFANASMGVWNITLLDGEAPRMRANPKMRELLRLPDTMTDETEIYNAWFTRVKPEALESVLASVENMKSGIRDENTYLWLDPVLGEQYVRCGGYGEEIPGKGWVLRGYHYNVNEEVLREQRREAERRRVVELRMKTVSEAIHGGFKLGKNDEKFTFIKVSEQLAQLLGYDSPEELMEVSGGCMAGIVNHEDTAKAMPAAMEAVARGEMYTMHYRVRCKDGSWKNVEDRGRLIVNEKGEEEFWSFIVNQDLLAELEMANEAKSNFLMNMSHDLRTPMNAILGYNKLMKKELTDPKLLDYQQKIEQSGSLLLSIINNVLDMARIESGKMELDMNYTVTENVLDEVMGVFAEEARKKGVTLAADIVIQHKHLLCDDTKIKEIFCNLVSNAVKYTPAGGTITVRARELPGSQPDTVRIRTEVIDTGIGMSKEFLPHLFDSFTRERNTTMGKVGGTGLGMTIVKKLVDLMEGTIEVESEVGKGTRFTVTLEHRIADENPCDGNHRAADSEASHAALAGKRILLAEDNELNAEIAMAILEEMGITADWVEDGIRCVAKLDSEPAYTYDLVLMDIQMPNMDGYKATRSIRLLPDAAKASIPVVAMTANAFAEDRRAAFEAGMNDHIAKPVDAKKLEEVILSVLKL